MLSLLYGCTNLLKIVGILTIKFGGLPSHAQLLILELKKGGKIFPIDFRFYGRFLWSNMIAAPTTMIAMITPTKPGKR